MGNVCFDGDKIVRKGAEAPKEQIDGSVDDGLVKRDSKMSDDNQSSYSALNVERMSGFDNLKTELQSIVKIYKRNEIKAESLIEITKGDKALQV